jgi:cyclopropane fatty-acyl-phospholipid synthase-like methyltransferase
MMDKSNGYEALAHEFMKRRSPTIGAISVREWSRALPRGASVLELGCGSGVPVSQVLADEGFQLFAIDASATLLEAYRKRFPDAHTECAAVEESTFFNRTFDGIVSWGLMFLLPADTQRIVIAKAARALAPGGRFLFTAGPEADEWPDVMTRRMSISLGADEYRTILRSHGLTVEGELDDEGENHYYFAARQ